MCCLGEASCCDPLSSVECGFKCGPECGPECGFLVDVSQQILDGDASRDELDQLFGLIPGSIWDDIDDIIKSDEAAAKAKQQRQASRKLVRKRQYREVAPAQLNHDYGLGRGKRARMDEEFAKPKTYQCEYCPADMLSVRVYLRHLKRHREAELRHRKSRCYGCGLLFGNIIETRWHQTRCLRRTIVGNL